MRGSEIKTSGLCDNCEYEEQPNQVEGSSVKGYSLVKMCPSCHQEFIRQQQEAEQQRIQQEKERQEEELIQEKMRELAIKELKKEGKL